MLNCIILYFIRSEEEEEEEWCTFELPAVKEMTQVHLCFCFVFFFLKVIVSAVNPFIAWVKVVNILTINILNNLFAISCISRD